MKSTNKWTSLAHDVKVVKDWSKSSYGRQLTLLLLAIGRTSELTGFCVQAFPHIKGARRSSKFALYCSVRFRILTKRYERLLGTFALHVTLGHYEGHEGTLRDLLRQPDRYYEQVLQHFPHCLPCKVQGTYVGQRKGSVIAYPTDALLDSLVLARGGMESCLGLDFARYLHFTPVALHVQFHPSLALLDGSVAYRRASYRSFKAWVRQQVRRGHLVEIPW